MWYADRTYTPEEIHVLKELEYDLFMFNPGFRSLWNNNFEEYFKALFNAEAWKEKQGQSRNGWEHNMHMDPKFRAFMQRQGLIDQVLFGDIDIKNVPLDVQREIEEIQRESQEAAEQVALYERLGLNPFEQEGEEEQDELYKKASAWREGLSTTFSSFYEQTKHIDAFRVLTNYGEVPAKIYSVVDDSSETDVEFEWRPDRIGYALALTSLNRCIESFENLHGFPELEQIIDAHLPATKEIRQELMDRLENIEMLRFRGSAKKNP